MTNQSQLKENVNNGKLMKEKPITETSELTLYETRYVDLFWMFLGVCWLGLTGVIAW